LLGWLTGNILTTQRKHRSTWALHWDEASSQLEMKSGLRRIFDPLGGSERFPVRFSWGRIVSWLTRR
jgi:hypothetical protein